MKNGRLPWRLVIVLVCASLARGKADPVATANYEKALQNLRSGDSKIDFKALRLNCAASKYECEADPDDTKALLSLLNEKKFDEALKKVDKSLEKVFVDAELHYVAFIANSESGNKEKAEFHKGVIRGLLDSIQEDKHGRSEEDAFVVINVHEEYTFLRFSNMQVTKQSLSHKSGHSYDVMVCKDDKGREVTAYFNIDIPEQSLADALK
ncbi:MAG TPA: DUF4919 domain-containing protein [Terriglobales bacterium]|nr:DUF4919 domain-containing protein [Terriglobales bacterium]